MDDTWSARPNTILVDSGQLESGEAMSPEFRSAVATDVEEFRAEYCERYPERDANEISEEDLLREVLNTVGKTGKLGEQIRCVVSVSMLTEGWDQSDPRPPKFMRLRGLAERTNAEVTFP